MKLNEIIDTSIKHRSVSTSYDDEKLRKEKNNYETMRGVGNSPKTGGFGRVHNKKNDPHLVTKVPHQAITDLVERDGYFAYIKYIADHKLANSNPYFLRVYDIKVFTDPNGKARFKADIEKLEDFDNITKEENDVIGNQIFGKIGFDELKDFYGWQYAILEGLRRIEYIEDKLCKRALLTIHEIIQNQSEVYKTKETKGRLADKFTLDIHNANIMLRRTPHGIQLVITDPIA